MYLLYLHFRLENLTFSGNKQIKENAAKMNKTLLRNMQMKV